MNIKLEYPILYQFKDDNHFAIISEAELDEHGFIEYFGKSYNYDDGEAVYQGDVRVNFTLNENSWFMIDENKNIID